MEKILIIDDDPNICEVVKLYLNSEGFETTIAYDGKSAIDNFRQEKHDLIILDIMLPILNGYEVLKEIRKESDIPIIMLTAKDDVIDKVVGFEIGADDYVVKPFEPRELVARVKAAIRRATTHKSHTDKTEKDDKIIHYPDLVINLSSYLVSYYGKEIELSPKEIELLFFLASNPNKVFTRDYLLEKIWDYNYPGNSRTVDEHIKRLRKKIPDHKDWAITTVWGVGYKFEVKV